MKTQATDKRSYKCHSCNGVVRIPYRNRTFTIEQMREHHNQTCPGTKKGNP